MRGNIDYLKLLPDNKLQRLLLQKLKTKNIAFVDIEQTAHTWVVHIKNGKANDGDYWKARLDNMELKKYIGENNGELLDACMHDLAMGVVEQKMFKLMCDWTQELKKE